MPRLGAARTARRALPWVLLAGACAAAVHVASGARLERADFVFNNSVEITTLDPATVTGVPEGRILRAIYEGLLVKHPRTLEPLPGQAESWEISADGRTYRFQIRENARWSNGDPVTAADFEFSYRRLLDPSTAAEYAYQLWYVRGAEDFSTWPPDAYATPDVWAQPVGAPAARRRAPAAGDRVRLGFARRPAAAAGQPSALVLAPVGSPLAAGQTFAELAGAARRVPFATPVSGVVVDANVALAEKPRRLAGDVYGQDRWIVELALDEAGAAALAALPYGEAWRQGELWQQVGIRAESPRTLVVELEHPTPFFLNLLAFYPLFPVHRGSLEEARRTWPRTWQSEWIKPENIVTNGPYRIRERRINDRIRLVKNPAYWDADNVAFRTIDALAVDHYGTALNLYLTGECDWLDATIPNNLIPRLLLREDLSPSPYLGSYFYRVNVTKPPLDDPRVRRALALTIDRLAICTKITKAGQRPLTSLVPQGLVGYAPQGFAQGDVLAAQALLADAGFGREGRPFPTLELHYNTSETHRDIAEVIAAGWRTHLGIEVQLQNQEWKVYLDSQSNLRYDLSRSAWIADYADPNSFLDLFVTDGENNKTGWSNVEYDDLIARAAQTGDPALRLEFLANAERILMNELPILPIYSYATQNLVNPRLGGFFENAQDEHFPKFWYWLSDAELAAKRASKKGAKGERVTARGPKNGLYAPARMREISAAQAAQAGQAAGAPGQAAGSPVAPGAGAPGGPGSAPPRGPSEPQRARTEGRKESER